MEPAEQQQAFIIRQYFAVRGPQQNGAQFRSGFLDSQCAHSDGEVRQLWLRRDGMKVVFDRTEIRRVLVIAKDRFEFFLFMLGSAARSRLRKQFRRFAALEMALVGRDPEPRQGAGWRSRRDSNPRYAFTSV